MPAQIADKPYFSFVGGLNTEGGYLNTPDNSWIEGQNFVPQIDGSIHRRPAINIENGGSYTATSYGTIGSVSSIATSCWKWVAVNGDGDREFAVVQQGGYLHIYDITAGTPISANFIDTIELSLYRYGYNEDILDFNFIQCASMFGQLMVTGKCLYPIIIRYNESTADFTVTQITIQIRDFAGVYQLSDPSLEKTPTEWEALGLAGAAYYNLYNQGWDATKISAYQTANSSKLPANTKQWIFGKDASDNFSATSLNKQDFGSSPAPKGRYILDALNEQRSVSGVVTRSSNNTELWQSDRPFTGGAVGASDYDVYDNFVRYGPRACAYFAGRAWYAGIPTRQRNGYVYFSQVTNDASKIGLCYQANDPTAEVISDLVDSDGGYIVIADVGDIIALRPAGGSLLVFATNGVWTITGGQSGFTATSYIVNKVSNVGALSAQSIVEVEDVYMYWSSTGIYAIQVDNTGSGKAENMSDGNIKTYYSNIPLACRREAQGAYNKIERRIEWVHGDDNANPVVKQYSLVFDLRMKCWFTYYFIGQAESSTQPIILSLFAPADMQNDSDYGVISGLNGDTVLTGVSETDVVVVPAQLRTGNSIPIKYLIARLIGGEGATWRLTFADLQTVVFSDWLSADPTSYIKTGYQLAPNGPVKQKTGQYITFLMKKTETALDGNGDPDYPSGGYVQTKWDFSDNDYANKWSASYQIYRQRRPYLLDDSVDVDDGHPVVIYKHKLRGRGHSVQWHITSETGKDLRLIGWNATLLGNQT